MSSTYYFTCFRASMKTGPQELILTVWIGVNRLWVSGVHWTCIHICCRCIRMHLIQHMILILKVLKAHSKSGMKPDYFVARSPESSTVVEIARKMVESDRSSFPLRLAACLPQYSLRIWWLKLFWFTQKLPFSLLRAKFRSKSMLSELSKFRLSLFSDVLRCSD